MNKYAKYMDTKNIIILVLLIGCLIFGYINLFRGDKLYEYRVKELELKNSELVKERLEIDKEIKTLKIDFTKLKEKEAELLDDINNRDIEIGKSKDRANKSKQELEKFKKDIEETKSKIENLKRNPANREGNDLLNSLKLKLNKK